MTDARAGAFDPFCRIRSLVEQMLAERGLALVSLSFLPAATPGGAHQVQVLATLAATATLSPVDDGFEEVLRSARAADIEIQRQHTIEDLHRKLSDDDGFL
jgi:hypothetical protein